MVVQELVSSTGVLTEGYGLWMVLTEMSKLHRQLRVQSGSNLFSMYGEADPGLRENPVSTDTMATLTIPARESAPHRIQ